MGTAGNFSVSRAERFQQFDFVEQSVCDFNISAAIFEPFAENSRVDRHHYFGISALDSRKFRRLAVRLSLRDDPASLVLRPFARKLTEKNNASRSRFDRLFNIDESLRDLAFSLDGIYKTIEKHADNVYSFAKTMHIIGETMLSIAKTKDIIGETKDIIGETKHSFAYTKHSFADTKDIIAETMLSFGVI